MRKKSTYIIYYTDKNDECEAWEVYGSDKLFEGLKWLKSSNIKAKNISIFKHGKNFSNDQDDVVEVYKYLWS